jgi:DNA-binding MarR family transcriptional regulator
MSLSTREYIQINQALFSLAHAYEARMEKETRADPNRPSMYECALLMVIGQSAPIQPNALSRMMDVSASMISIYVRKLTRKGLVQMERDPCDNRNGWITLTEPGEMFYQAIIEGTANYTREFFAALDENELQTLRELLLKASHSLGFKWQ